MSEQFVIFLDDRAWRVAMVRDEQTNVELVTGPDDAEIPARVEAASQHLGGLGHAGQPVALALASSWCLCAAISTEDLERGRRRRAMGFRLEEHLPIATEDIVADYVDLGGEQALGVCSPLEKLRPVVDGFEAAGVPVRHICPAALLAAGLAVEQQDDLDGVLIASAGYDLVELARRTPAGWWWLAEDHAAVRSRVDEWTARHDAPVRLAAIGETTDIQESVGSIGGVEIVESVELSADEAAANQAARVLDDVATPWIDLRREALAAPGRYEVYRKPVVALVTAVVLLLVSVLLVTQWRGGEFADLRDGYERQQAEVFRETFPDQRVPGSITGRLRSERRRLAGLGGVTSEDDDRAAMRAPSALAHLHEVLGALPEGVRFRILDLSIEPDLIRIDGQARSHADAERVAVALRESGRYEVEPPKTQALREQGVSFVFTARPRTQTAVAKGGGR